MNITFALILLLVVNFILIFVTEQFVYVITCIIIIVMILNQVHIANFEYENKRNEERKNKLKGE